MPSYVLKCEGCGGYEPFLVHEDELLENAKKQPFRRYCPTCRRMSSWTVAWPERRSGRDRRSSLERRATK